MQDIKENLTSEVSNYIVSVFFFFFFFFPLTAVHQNKRTRVKWWSRVAHFVPLEPDHSYQ